ncbi:TPA: thioredoxin family protein [Candidatus Micrarchaeota archaeon]|nr:thioredoxin family protein [Candidatus Micrarchaeota archaeon]
MQTKTLVLILVAVIAIGFGLFFFSSAPVKKNYVDSSSPVMYFFSPQCKFCKLQEPILNELASEGYKVKEMDVLAHPEYWAQYNITGTPTFLAANGDRQAGLTQKTELRTWLESHNARIVS